MEAENTNPPAAEDEDQTQAVDEEVNPNQEEPEFVDPDEFDDYTEIDSDDVQPYLPEDSFDESTADFEEEH
jgi:hypothetical protein